MLFLFKKSKMVLDAFTYDETAHEYFPVDYANKFIPEWWKNLPKQNTQGLYKGNNMRSCSGFIDFYSKKSLIIPLWCSFIFSPGHNGNCKQMTPNNNTKEMIEGQGSRMRGNEYLKSLNNLKYVLLGNSKKMVA